MKNCLCDLPQEIFCTILRDYLPFIELGLLDTALCCEKYRHFFLRCISREIMTFRGMDKPENMYCIMWLYCRRMFVNRLNCGPEVNFGPDMSVTTGDAIMAYLECTFVLELNLSSYGKLTDTELNVVLRYGQKNKGA